MHDRKNRTILYICITILIILIGIGISYAYFTAIIKNNETTSTIVGNAAYLEVTFEDQNSTITGTNLIPGWSATKNFTVENTGDNITYYKLKMTDITNELLEGSLSYQITSSDGGANIAKQTLPTTAGTISNTVSIAKGVTHTYAVTAYYNRTTAEQLSELGSSFSFTITIENAQPINN